MLVKKQLTFLVVFLFSVVMMAQQTAIYTSPLTDYQKALQLFNNQQYLAAQTLFSQVKKQTDNPNIESDCAFYIANSAIRLNQQGADTMMENFVENYPTSTKKNTAFLDVADYYFENGKYAYAQKWYEKVDEASMSRADREKFNFNNGYASFVTKNYNDAKKYLTRVETSQKYGSQAKYYLGFMSYQGDDYDSANKYFDQVSDDEKYKEKLSYYQADLNFKLGKFEKAIELAKEKLPTSDRNEISELNKIIGESYFNLEKVSGAIPIITN